MRRSSGHRARRARCGPTAKAPPGGRCRSPVGTRVSPDWDPSVWDKAWLAAFGTTLCNETDGAVVFDTHRTQPQGSVTMSFNVTVNSGAAVGAVQALCRTSLEQSADHSEDTSGALGDDVSPYGTLLGDQPMPHEIAMPLDPVAVNPQPLQPGGGGGSNWRSLSRRQARRV